MNRRSIGLVAVIVAALGALLVSMMWATSALQGPTVRMMDDRGGMMGYSSTTNEMGIRGGPMMGGPMMVDGSPMMGGMMGGHMMMGSGYGVAGTGPVATLEQARNAAQRYADRLGLEVGEVMEFDNGFYAVLHTAEGGGATEVLVDPDTGDVRIEFGPAMMWNTDYGMHASRSSQPAQVSTADARRLAAESVAERGDGWAVGEPHVFPGYYTLHTLLDGEIVGMVSVNAYSGMVWHHTWHGDFVDMSEE